MNTIGIFLLVGFIIVVAVLQAILIKILDFPIMIKFENQMDLINFVLKVNEKYDRKIPLSRLEDHELDLIITVPENIIQEMPKEIWHYKIIQSLTSLYI